MWFDRADREFCVGDRVHAHECGRWHPAVLTRAGDGVYDAVGEDGSVFCGLGSKELRAEVTYPPVELGATLNPWDAADDVVVAGRGSRRQTGGEDSPPQPEAPAPRVAAAPPRRGANRWSEGARVSADYCGLGYYHDATVSGSHADGTYSLRYDDGLTEDRVPPSRVAPPGGGGDASWDPPPPRAAPAKPAERRRSRASAATPPLRAVRDVAPPARRDGLREGSRASGNWNGLGYWHPCTVVAVLPGGTLRLQYDDGFEEEAPPSNVLPAGARGWLHGWPCRGGCARGSRWLSCPGS